MEKLDQVAKNSEQLLNAFRGLLEAVNDLASTNTRLMRLADIRERGLVYDEFKNNQQNYIQREIFSEEYL